MNNIQILSKLFNNFDIKYFKIKTFKRFGDGNKIRFRTGDGFYCIKSYSDGDYYMKQCRYDNLDLLIQKIKKH
jgi:hypothetical protein